MRIAVWHNLPSGGGKRALYYHVRGLLERGHTVESWCPSTADQTYLPLGELIREHVLPLEVRPSGSARGPITDLRTLRNRVDLLKAMDEHCRKCANEMNRGGFDLLLANACMFYRATPIGRYVSIPSAIYLQEPYRWLYEALPRLPWVAPQAHPGHWPSPGYVVRFARDLVKTQHLRVQAREELLSARAFGMILVNSMFSRESVLRAYGLDAKVCYLGVDTGLFRDLRLPREGFVVGLGGFTPEKNAGLIIRALGKVAAPRPRLVWIANVTHPGYSEEMTQLAHSVDVELDLRIRVRDDEVVSFLNRGALMAYAPRLEPFGFAPLEANACALPVIAIAEGGVRETVLDGVNGLLVEHDPRAMGMAIERLMGDRTFARELGQNGHRLISERWSLKAAVDRLESRLVEVQRKADGGPMEVGSRS